METPEIIEKPKYGWPNNINHTPTLGEEAKVQKMVESVSETSSQDLAQIAAVARSINRLTTQARIISPHKMSSHILIYDQEQQLIFSQEGCFSEDLVLGNDDGRPHEDQFISLRDVYEIPPSSYQSIQSFKVAKRKVPGIDDSDESFAQKLNKDVSKVIKGVRKNRRLENYIVKSNQKDGGIQEEMISMNDQDDIIFSSLDKDEEEDSYTNRRGSLIQSFGISAQEMNKTNCTFVKKMTRHGQKVNIEILVEDNDPLQPEELSLDDKYEIKKEEDKSERVDLGGPVYKLQSTSKDLILQLTHLSKSGMQDSNLLKKSVLINISGTVKIYSKRSLMFCLSTDNWLRLAAINLIERKMFEYTILMVIVFNSVALSLYDYSDRDSLSRRNQVIDNFNKAFTFIYAAEALIKILALGFVIPKRSYLRDGWNFIDFFVVISGLVDIFSTSPTQGLRTIRIFRVIRPLKSINSFPALRKHVNTLFLATPSFLKVFFFVSMVYLFFAIFGLHFYGTDLYNRCRFNPEPESNVSWKIDYAYSRPCTKLGGSFVCPKDRYCGNPYDFGLPLSIDNVIDNSYINYGINVFDNIGTSILVVHQLISLDSWSSYVLNMMDIEVPIVGIIYGLLIVIFGSYVVMNLILAVIIDTFTVLQEEELRNQLSSYDNLQLIVRVSDGEINLEEFKRLSYLQQEREQRTPERRKEDANKPKKRLLLNVETTHKKKASDLFLDKLKEKTQFSQTNQDSDLLKMDMMKLHNIQKLEIEETIAEKNNSSLLKRGERNPVFKILQSIVNSKYFMVFIMACIIANTCILAMDGYPHSYVASNLKTIDYFFASVFILELVLKLIALGVKLYFLDPFNILDCIIIMVTVVEIIVNLNSNSSANMGTALRGLRVIGLFRLAKTWKRFHILLKTMGRTLIEISTFTIVVFLFMFINTMLGLELFAYKVKFNSKGEVDLVNGTSTNQNFDTFIWSFTTVFVLLTADSWSNIWFQLYRAIGPWKATIYVFSIYIIGNRILLNLFLAILLQNFDEVNSEQELSKEIQEVQNQASPKVSDTRRNLFERVISYLKQNWFGTESMVKMNKSVLDESSTPLDEIEAPDDQVGPQNNPKQPEEIDAETRFVGVSLFIFDQESKIRLVLIGILLQKYFERLILTVILISSVQLALNSPLNDPNGDLQNSLYWVDLVTTVVFFGESLMKIVCYGFLWCGKSSYLRNPWNILDFTVMILSVISVSPLAITLQSFKMFRIVRVLRLIGQDDGLKIGLQALIRAMPNALRITAIMLIFFLVFGIVSVSQFKGNFYFCKSAKTSSSSLTDWIILETVSSKWDCINTGGDWQNMYYNFDNIWIAMAPQFIMCVGSGWQNFMYNAAQVTDIDYVGRKWTNLLWIFYYIFFMLVSCFFLLNLFIGVIISSFNKEKDILGGNAYLTEKQKEWVDTHIIVLNAKPIRKALPPINCIRRLCFLIMNKTWFHVTIKIFVFSYIVLLTLGWGGQTQEQRLIILLSYDALTILLSLEFAIKILGKGRLYFAKSWNILDCIVLIFQILSIYLCHKYDYRIQLQGGGYLWAFVCICRVSFTFRTIKYAKYFHHIYNTLIISVPLLVNIGSLLLLIVYIYTIAGVILFGRVMRNNVLKQNLNFESFEKGAFTLFVIASTDSWADIVQSLLRQPTTDYQCIADPSYDQYVDNGFNTVGCGQHYAGVLFFFSYFILIGLIMLKLFIAVILQAYNDIKLKEDKVFNDKMVSNFIRCWQNFDPEATGLISKDHLKPFLQSLGSPLDFNAAMGEQEQVDFLNSFDLLQSENGEVYTFINVLDRVSIRFLAIDYGLKNRKISKEEEIKQNSMVRMNDWKEKELRLNMVQSEYLGEINSLAMNEKRRGILAVKQIQNILSQKEKYRTLSSKIVDQKHSEGSPKEEQKSSFKSRSLSIPKARGVVNDLGSEVVIKIQPQPNSSGVVKMLSF